MVLRQAVLLGSLVVTSGSRDPTCPAGFTQMIRTTNCETIRRLLRVHR